MRRFLTEWPRPTPRRSECARNGSTTELRPGPDKRFPSTGIEPGRKSLTFALRFRAPDRTLTAAEASDAKLAGVAVAAARFDATLRE